MSNWPNGTHYGHSNWTGSIPRSSRHYQGGYIEGSEKPPGGWMVAIIKGAIVFFGLIFFFSLGGALIGM